MDNELSLTLQQRINAPCEAVFDAWLDPQRLAQFMRTGPDTGVKRATTDAVVGGRYEITMTNEMGEVPHWGVYQVIDRPRQLVFTWNSPHAATDSIVTLTFAASDGGTLLTLTHEKFPSEQSLNGHKKGWAGILTRLAQEFCMEPQ